MVPVFRLTVFFALFTSVFAAGTLYALVNAAQGFALANSATNRRGSEHY
jgi:hypothetical protein